MNTKSLNLVLILITIVALSFGGYQFYKSSSFVKETSEWKSKYEEALIDMEEANKRIEIMKEDLEKALKESEEHRIKAEEALLELQKHKAGKK
jgi:hypothetical protein